MAKHQPVEIVRMMCEDVYGKGNTELIRELLNDDYKEHDPLMGTLDTRGVEQNVRMFRAAFPDMTMQVLDSAASGDLVTARWRATGTHRGELMGKAATNKRVTVEGITMVRIQNGKAHEGWVQWDTLGMMRTLGLAPELPTKRPDGGARPGAGAQRR